MEKLLKLNMPFILGGLFTFGRVIWKALNTEQDYGVETQNTAPPSLYCKVYNLHTAGFPCFGTGPVGGNAGKPVWKGSGHL